MAKQTAKLNYLKIAPRKVRLVAGSIRGLQVDEAEAALMLQPKRSAKPLLKLLRSAMANAKVNQKLNADDLYIQTILVDQGPMLKRHLPRARGVATPIQKKMSHVTLVLEERKAPREKKFKIVIQKKLKDKTLKGGVSKEREKEPRMEERPAQKEQKASGMFKRFFRRKAV